MWVCHCRDNGYKCIEWFYIFPLLILSKYSVNLTSQISPISRFLFSVRAFHTVGSTSIIPRVLVCLNICISSKRLNGFEKIFLCASLSVYPPLAKILLDFSTIRPATYSVFIIVSKKHYNIVKLYPAFFICIFKY